MSQDSTASRAAESGAIVRTEPKLGKGAVVRRMFAEIEADVYVIADGDGTYDPVEAPILVEELQGNDLDMVVGIRSGITSDARRTGHAIGNRLFNRLYRILFGTGFTDILSGYRAFSHRFVKSFPAVSTGFEIETEMSVHASQLGLPTGEVEISYYNRPEGSESKLRSFVDGLKILRAMLVLLKENRPFVLFGGLGALAAGVSILLGVPVIVDFS